MRQRIKQSLTNYFLKHIKWPKCPFKTSLLRCIMAKEENAIGNLGRLINR